jgi:hypothetical protein
MWLVWYSRCMETPHQPLYEAVPVYFGSTRPEYHLYLDGKFIKYWSVYHDGNLPPGYSITHTLKGKKQTL